MLLILWSSKILINFLKGNKVQNLCSEKEESTLTEKEKLDLAMKLINENVD